MARIYLASSWRNMEQPIVVKKLRHAGHSVYDFRNPFHGNSGFSWRDIDGRWQDWTAQQYRENLLRSPIAAYGFMSDKRAMEWADTCLLLLPCGRSAHLEAGWFAGANKRLIILTRDGEEPELMALLATEICISIDEVLDVLERGVTASW